MTNDLLKVQNLLKTRGCSDRTISNYTSCINRFKNYFKERKIQNLNEDDILNYLKVTFIDKGLSSASFNINRAAIKYYYLINFDKTLSKELLPQCKIKNKFPILISKDEFVRMFNSELNLKHKIWLILSYGSGMRREEVARLKVNNILSKEHKIKVFGKGNKERYVPLPDITLKLLRLYWIKNKSKITGEYLFPGIHKSKNKYNHISPETIGEVFDKIRINNNLDSSVSFHTLRHSFATEFIKSGGDIWELRLLLGHSTLNSTIVYLHMAKDFSIVKSPLNEVNL